MITPNVITAPTTEAISTTELKQQLALDDVSEINLAIYQTAAREYYEWRTGRTMHETELEFILDAFPSGDTIILPRATPLISITSIKYTDSDGTEITWGATNYIADTWNTPGAVVLAYNESWPSFTAYPVAPIKIRYVAGIETASPTVTEADDADKIPILMLAAALCENREQIVVSDRAAVTQLSVKCGAEAFIRMRQVIPTV